MDMVVVEGNREGARSRNADDHVGLEKVLTMIIVVVLSWDLCG